MLKIKISGLDLLKIFVHFPFLKSEYSIDSVYRDLI